MNNEFENPLERMLVVFGKNINDYNGDGYIALAKGFYVEQDIESVKSCYLNDLGIELPEGHIAGLMVYETHPFIDTDYDDWGASFSESATWRSATQEEIDLFIKGSYDGLLNLWSDVQSRAEVEAEIEQEALQSK